MICPCGREIIKDQFCTETPAQFAKREASAYCRPKCKRLFAPVKPERSKPTLSLTSYNVERPEMVGQAKEINWRSEGYLDFIRSNPSVVSNQGDCIAHHVGKKGAKGIACKVGDDRAVPLTPVEHAQLHHMGEKAFWLLHKIDIEVIIIRLNESYNFEQKYKEKRP